MSSVMDEAVLLSEGKSAIVCEVQVTMLFCFCNIEQTQDGIRSGCFQAIGSDLFHFLQGGRCEGLVWPSRKILSVFLENLCEEF